MESKKLEEMNIIARFPNSLPTCREGWGEALQYVNQAFDF